MWIIIHVDVYMYVGKGMFAHLVIKVCILHFVKYLCSGTCSVEVCDLCRF